MTIPAPEVPLQDACSTIFNNTLYTYMNDAFQSLPLVQGAEWSMLPMGVPVKGGACAKSTPKNNTAAAALYIVGGTTNSSSYRGLQRYIFADGTWETLMPTVAVTQNRLYHGAVYLNASDSILVYAGTQDGSKQASSQTFTIKASAPYAVTAYEAIAPPAISPILIQWTDSQAIYIGGSETNTKAMIFSPSDSWRDSNATLAAPLYNTSNIKAVVINGDDASKTLYTFDATVSPNSVNRTILIDADGNPVQNAMPIIGRGLDLDARSSEKRSKGNLTIQDWPRYNDSLVSSSTRTGYTISSDQSGLVVIAGGNAADVLCMFKARDNCWANATSFLGSKTVSQQGIQIGSTPSASATATSTKSTLPAATTSSALTSNGGYNSPFPVKLLAAVLGSILVVAFLVLAFLVIFRWQRKRRQHYEAGHHRRASGLPEEKDRMDFQDRGVPEMVSTRQFPGHEQQSSQGSYSSMAILMGRVSHKRDDEKQAGSSDPFAANSKATVGKPMPREESYPAFAGSTRDEKVVSFAEEQSTSAPRSRPSKGGRRGSTRRSSGWNRYWSGGSGMTMLGFGGSKRATYVSNRTSDSQSEYAESRRLPSQVARKSALVPPLKIGERPFELNKVISGSPTISYRSNQVPLPKEMSGHILRSDSVSSISSYDEQDRRDAFSSGIPASIDERNTWTPVDGQAWGRSIAPSNYSESVYAPTITRDTANFQMPQRESRFPGQPLYPPQGSTKYPTQSNQHTSDMSWLNLGTSSKI